MTIKNKLKEQLAIDNCIDKGSVVLSGETDALCRVLDAEVFRLRREVAVLTQAKATNGYVPLKYTGNSE